MAVKVIYEADATDLKMADRRKRILRSSAMFIFQLALIFILVSILGVWAMFIFLLAMFMFLPAPIIPTPSKYKITSQGVMLDERRIFSLKKEYKLRANEERKFVSILHRRRGEILRLYTSEPKRVVNILDKIIPKQKQPRRHGLKGEGRK
ncbi:MAG: hypothetical protein AOA65_0710 [Candidatus Bathyarchaeota archaeon BA1]|nr:MAG: hypothetical protein AOA65_0710 [Candidatus Bathyarchaeota archaeon BA1]